MSLKDLEELEITLRRTSKPRETWGPFASIEGMDKADLPYGENASFQIVIKANGGYGENHETGATIITNMKGQLGNQWILHVIHSALSGYSQTDPEECAETSEEGL